MCVRSDPGVEIAHLVSRATQGRVHWGLAQGIGARLVLACHDPRGGPAGQVRAMHLCTAVMSHSSCLLVIIEASEVFLHTTLAKQARHLA